MTSEKRPIGLRAEQTEHVYGATVETGDPSVCGAEIPLNRDQDACKGGITHDSI